MATWRVRRFTEPSEFAAALPGVKADLSVLGGGHFVAEIGTVELGSVRIHRLSESLPRIMHFDHLGGRATFAFHTQPGPSLIRSGVEVTSETIVRVGERQSLFHRSSGPISWGTISLPLTEVHSVAQAIPGCDLRPLPHEQLITPLPGALATLQRVHAAVGSLPKQAPTLLDNCEVARGTEQILLQALVACLDSNDVHEQRPSQRHHQKVMQRFHALLRANPSRPLYVLEIARAVGASVRSLSECCQEHIGIGPKKYLLLRRLHLAQRALLVADPQVTSVTDVATQYGFWQFGRFSGQYRSLFGELPSATLRRSRA
jgi:AraC-like DNA-binding protein